MAWLKLERLGNLKLKEIETFYLAAKTRSIREVARRSGTTPGQISKTIKSIEKKLDAALFKRSALGIVLSERGSELVHLAEAILDNAYKMELNQAKDGRKMLAIAATPFLINHLISIAAARTLEKQTRYSLRLLDVGPDEFIKLGLRGAFEVAFHFNRMDWPRTWVSENIGSMEWVLVARDQHPLKKTAPLEDLLKYPYIQPTYWTSEGLMKGNDFFEVPISKRIAGYETSTADAAVPLVLRTNHLAVLPRVMVQSLLDSGELKQIKSPKLKGTSRDLYLSAKADALTSQVYGQLRREVEGLLSGS